MSWPFSASASMRRSSSPGSPCAMRSTRSTSACSGTGPRPAACRSRPPCARSRAGSARAPSRTSSGDRAALSASSASPRTPLSGVRSSCAISAEKRCSWRRLERDARRAARRASPTARSARRAAARARSAGRGRARSSRRRCAVMSATGCSALPDRAARRAARRPRARKASSSSVPSGAIRSVCSYGRQRQRHDDRADARAAAPSQPAPRAAVTLLPERRAPSARARRERRRRRAGSSSAPRRALDRAAVGEDPRLLVERGVAGRVAHADPAAACVERRQLRVGAFAAARRRRRRSSWLASSRLTPSVRIARPAPSTSDRRERDAVRAG